jgi:acyl-[acyl-carrier-protein] desaturase
VPLEFAVFTRIDHALEPRLRELYRRHREASAKVDWSYASLLPWEQGRNFTREPWTPEQRRLSEPMYVAVETALLTEANLPWFTAGLDGHFRGAVAVLHDFLRTWTSEEDQHSDLLQTYLLLTRNGDPHRLHALRRQVIEQGFVLDYSTPIEIMVYTTIQELATRAFYLSVAGAGAEQDPTLSTILRRLARDETLHYGFYRDVVAAHLNADPNYVWPVAHVLCDFNMPGHDMPEFRERMRLIAHHAGYGPSQYYHQVVDALVKYWGIRQLQPTLAEAIEARHRILRHHDRLARLARRLDGGEAVAAACRPEDCADDAPSSPAIHRVGVMPLVPARPAPLHPGATTP